MTISEKINKILNDNGVRSSYPEKLKEELRVLIIQECERVLLEKAPKSTH